MDRGTWWAAVHGVAKSQTWLNDKHYKRQGRALHNVQGINPKRRYNNYKYICIQHRTTTLCKTNANKYEREINSNTITVGDFNTPLSPMDRSNKQKINKETQTLNDTIDQLDIYRTFHPKTMNFTLFSSAHGTFSRIDHILGHKSSLGKFKIIESISSIFCDHNAVRLDVNSRKKTIKIQTYGC